MSRFGRDLSKAVRPRRTAELRAAGVSRRALAGPAWRQVAHGWHVPGGDPTPTQRIVESVSRASVDTCLGGWAAAYVLGADTLDGRDPRTGAVQPVLLLTPPEVSRLVAPGVQSVRTTVPRDQVARRRGYRLTDGTRTALDLACWAPDLTEAVVALDALLGAQVVRRAELDAAARVLARRRGARQARRAAQLAVPGVRSTWETRLRMLCVLDLGLTTWLVNRPVFDLDGHFCGAPDLLDSSTGLALEFDGAGHRNRRQHRADNVREEGLERLGLVVVRADSLDLMRHRVQLGRRIVDARRDAASRAHAPRRWTLVELPWWQGLPA